MKQSIEGENSHGEECGYYRLYQEAKTEGEGQHKRADKYEKAWRLSEDSVQQLQGEHERARRLREDSMRQLQGEHQKNRDLLAIVEKRDKEIIVLQRRIQDLHEDLDEEMARRLATDI